MSVTPRPYRGGGWEVDLTIRLPDGSQYRERKRASRFSKSAAHRWAEDRERPLLQHGPPTAKREVPTLETFAPRFVDGHARANRHKPSGINAIESILRWHLVPTPASKRLDAITNEQVQRLKLALTHRAPKTVNNVLTVLSTLLIQELAGHADLSTTQRYMHLSPAATEDAIRLLDARESWLQDGENLGDILDTRKATSESTCEGRT
jgi:hypothetical protein